jgi:hypothetical protein
MSEWIIEVNDGEEVLGRDDGLYDAIVSDTFNPFGNYAKGFFDDLEGQLFDLFQRGTKVSFQYSNDNTNGFTQRFVGYVVNDLEQEADGAEQLEIEAHTFDQFLRGDEVTNDQTGNTIFEALEDVITTDIPPVSWDASLVEVQNNIELTQSFQGETVEEFILAVRQKSAGEIFGVTENLEFFFEPSEISRTRRDIDNSQWVTHDIGEEAAETDNQVTVYYDDGNEAVTVDDTGDQLTLQENLAAGGPGQEGTSITRDDITNIEDAIDAGEAYLNGRAATLTGPVTTFDLNSAQPGDVIGITIEPRGIEGDFRIAENRMQWRSETNELTVVQKKGADDDILIEQSKTLKRVENRPRDTSVIPDRVTDSVVEGIITVTGDADGVPLEITRVTNDGRNLIRDGWINKNTIDVTGVAVSSSDARPSRSDSNLDGSVTTGSVTQNLPDAYSVEYTGTVTATDVRTVALFNRNATLIAVGRLEESVTDPSITVTLTVDTSPREDKSALVENGQIATRDILADNNPEFVDEYGYGSDTSDVAETDTSLTRFVTNELDDLEPQNAFGSGLADVITNQPDDKPVVVSNDGLELAQTAFVGEAEDNLDTPDSEIVSDVSFSGGEAVKLFGRGEQISLDFELNHTIPSERLYFAIRGRKETNTGNGDTLTLAVDGNNIRQSSGQFADTTVAWSVQSFDSASTEFDLTAGSHTFSVEVASNREDRLEVDYVALLDKQFYPDEADFDNTVHQDNGYLNDPKLYPEQQQVEFNTVTTDIEIDSVFLGQSWNDTSENQQITISPGETFQNTQDASVDYTQRVTEVNARATLSRYPETTNAQSATPRFGYNRQLITFHGLNINLDAIQRNEIGEVLVRSFTGPGTANTETFAEGGQQSDGTLITRARIPEFEKQSGQRVISSEKLRWINDPEN